MTQNHKLSTSQAVDLLLAGHSLRGCVLDDCSQVDLYNHWQRLFEQSSSITCVEPTPQQRVSTWFMPPHAQNVDILEYLLSQDNTPREKDRICMEMKRFRDLDLEPLLRMVKYLVEEMTRKNLVWGVGRGSSVASFVLYRLGLNQINPMDYDLDFNEFLPKEES